MERETLYCPNCGSREFEQDVQCVEEFDIRVGSGYRYEKTYGPADKYRSASPEVRCTSCDRQWETTRRLLEDGVSSDGEPLDELIMDENDETE